MDSSLPFRDFLEQRGYVLADGATGTNLFRLGLQNGEAPELWNLNFPERVRSLHRDFIAAGSDIILTNSFGCNRQRLALHGAENETARLAKTAARLALAEAQKAQQPITIAGSIGPTGALLAPLGELSRQQAEEIFSEQAEALVEGGVDLLWIETMSAENEILAALRAAKKTGKPVAVTLSFDTNGCTMMGIAPETIWSLFEKAQLWPDAIGANCGLGVSDTMLAILKIRSAVPKSVPVIVKSNCGIPSFEKGEFVWSGTPELMAHYAVLARNAGASIIGACCGAGRTHIAEMKRALETTPQGPPPDENAIIQELGPVSSGPKRKPDAERTEPKKRRRSKRK